MVDPNIRTKVVHSKSKDAYNVIGTRLGSKYKICKVPYYVSDNDILTEREKKEAFDHANFISYCFNNSKQIIKNI